MQPPPPERQQLLGALAGNATATRQFFGVPDGSVPFGAFFAPENIGRIMAGAVPVA